MFVFACSIIAKSQCWLFVLRATVFALICPYLHPYSTSGIYAMVSKIIYFAVKVQGKMMHKDMPKIVFQ